MQEAEYCSPGIQDCTKKVRLEWLVTEKWFNLSRLDLGIAPEGGLYVDRG